MTLGAKTFPAILIALHVLTAVHLAYQDGWQERRMVGDWLATAVSNTGVRGEGISAL